MQKHKYSAFFSTRKLGKNDARFDGNVSMMSPVKCLVYVLITNTSIHMISIKILLERTLLYGLRYGMLFSLSRQISMLFCPEVRLRWMFIVVDVSLLHLDRQNLYSLVLCTERPYTCKTMERTSSESSCSGTVIIFR